AIRNAAGTRLWHWPLSGGPFGDDAPNEDADGNGRAFVFNLRFPGQYFDAETGLHYNYFRDYEPGTGRYVESDPFGLQAGPSLFSYVGSAPLTWIDSLGLRRHCTWTRVPRRSFYEPLSMEIEYIGIEEVCVDVPDELPQIKPCEFGTCTCYQRCVNQEPLFGYGGTRLREN